MKIHMLVAVVLYSYRELRVSAYPLLEIIKTRGIVDILYEMPRMNSYAFIKTFILSFKAEISEKYVWDVV